MNLLIYLDFIIVVVPRVAVSVITNREFWLGHYLVFVLLDLFQIFCANLYFASVIVSSLGVFMLNTI